MLNSAVNSLGIEMETQLNDIHSEEFPETLLEVSNDINNYNNLKQNDDEENLTSNNNDHSINIQTNKDKEHQSLRLKNNNQETNLIINKYKKFYFIAKELFLYLIEKIFNKLTSLFRFIGPVFSITIITFLLYTYISGIKNIFPYWQRYYYKYETNKKKYIFIKIIIFIELCYTLFNFILASIIKPGNVKDIRNSKYYQTHSPYFSNDLILPHYNNDDMEKGIKNNIKTKIKWSKCKKCNEIKPLRTHHCSICGTCNFKMDHHCPWINNCVGQNNHRYFLLFILHLFFYTVTLCSFALPIFFNKKTKILYDNIYSMPDYNKKINIANIKYIAILGITGFFIEIFFNGWNWYLAINGNTVIEFWAVRTDYRTNSNNYNFSFTFGSWRKNLFYIFGTSNILKIIFVPSIKKLPFSGLELSKFIDPNFDIDCLNE